MTPIQGVLYPHTNLIFPWTFEVLILPQSPSALLGVLFRRAIRAFVLFPTKFHPTLRLIDRCQAALQHFQRNITTSKGRKIQHIADIDGGNHALILVNAVDMSTNPTVEKIGRQPLVRLMRVRLGRTSKVRELWGINSCKTDMNLYNVKPQQ